jgi:hypothetical protein
MADEGGFCDDGSQFTEPGQANNGNEYMNEKQEDVAHRGMVSKTQKWPEFRIIL